MKFVTFVPKKGAAPRVGVVREANQVVDLTLGAGRAPFDPHDMISLIASGAKGLAWAKQAAAKAKKTLPLAKVRLLAPIPRPRKNVFCVGWNYVEHFEEGKKARAHGIDYPAHPAFFSKAPTTVIGPYDPVPFDAEINKTLDWEAELGVIVGRGGKNIAEANAMKHVFGYTVINDISARDVQIAHGGQWFKGKSLDGSCPMGPMVVTADEFGDPQAKRLQCRVNGVSKQDASTADMIFPVATIIEWLSKGLTLEAGDVIATGTPSGVGMGRDPKEFLQKGDVVETEIEGIGTIRNRIAG